MFKSNSTNLEVDEAELVKLLRKESQDVKDCFTKFSFQILIVSTAVLGVIIRYQGDHPMIAITGVAMISLLLVVSRIGTYKYFTHNRHLGYELHLYRTRDLPDNKNGGWEKRMRNIGWEEAMRAWRIVQGTQFEYLHRTIKFWPNFLIKHEIDYHRGEYEWFLPKKLVKRKPGYRGEKSQLFEEPAQYYAGSYLRTMLSILHVTAVGFFVPLIIMVVQFSNRTNYNSFVTPSIIALVLAAIAVGLRILQNDVRRRILEEKTLSIHSCAILWQAVVVAHYRALGKMREEESRLPGFREYTQHLSVEAISLRRNILRIHEWINKPDSPNNER